MPPRKKAPDSVEGERPTAKKTETVGIVLDEHHKAALEDLQMLSGLSRSEFFRRLLDATMLYAAQGGSTVLDIVLTRDELQQKLLEALRGYEDGGPYHQEGGNLFIRRVIQFAHAGPISVYDGHLRFEGYVTFNADVREEGKRCNRNVTMIIVAEVISGRIVQITDWGPEVEEIGPVRFIRF